MTLVRRAVACGVLVVAGGLAGGCAASAGEPAEERARLVDDALAGIGDTLSDGLDRARRALALAASDAGAASDGAPAGETGRPAERRRLLDLLDRARDAANVDGLVLDTPSGDRLSSGRPVEPRDLPAARPFDESFGTGDVVFHAGPFLRALVVSGAGPRGGTARATVILADPTTSPLDDTVELRWARAFRVRAVQVLPPSSLSAPTEFGVVRVGIPRGATSPVLTLEVAAPDEDVVRALVEERARRRAGPWLLLGGAAALLVGALLVRRVVSAPAGRAAAGVVGTLLARQGLLLLDAPARFPEVAPAFRTTDFGLPGLFGWLSTPADLAATGSAALLVSLFLVRLVAAGTGTRSRAVRAGSGALAVALAIAAVVGWLRLVHVAANESRIDVFGAGALLPSVPTVLLLAGLCAATAAAFVFARAALRRIEAATPRLPRAVPRIAGALGIAAVAAGMSPDGSMPFAFLLVPGAAALLGRLRGGDARPGAPSRILLTSILSATLLIPVLFVGAAQKLRADLRAEVADRVRRASDLEGEVDTGLTGLAADPTIAQALAGTRRDPDELAFRIWLALGFQRRAPVGAVVSVFDLSRRRVSRFALNTPSPRWLPAVEVLPDSVAADLALEQRPRAGDALECVVGRLRVRDEDGRPVGHVVVVVADPLAVEVARAGPTIPALSSRARAEEADAAKRPLSLRLVANGRVVATNDPRAPATAPAGLPPPEDLSRPAWIPSDRPGGREMLAADAGTRGILLAEPARRESDEILFGIARVVIVAVGLGLLLALATLVAGASRFRPRLQDKILASYFLISVVPLVFLGYAAWTDAVHRSDEELRRRHEVVVQAAQDEFQRAGIDATPGGPEAYAVIQTEGVATYRGGELEYTSFPGLVAAELVPQRLPSAALRATELESRDLHVEDSFVAGTPVRTAYAPLRAPSGERFGTIAVPVRYDPESAARAAAETGSLLVAAYLLTLVLVVVIGIYTARGLARPLGELLGGTRRVGAGELSTAIPGEGSDEIGQLVTAFNTMTRDLASTRDLAARAEREAAWRGMARQIAHEIKNPLTPMKLLLQQLVASSKSDPAFAQGMVEPTAKVVLEQIDALSRIASDFSAFARFPPRALAPCDVNGILRSVATLYGPGEAGAAQVVAELEEGLPPVRWDEDELRRVFVNLVANGVQAVDEAKGRVRVTVRSTRSQVPGTGVPAVLVTVTDDGVGIPAENRARLFEPDFSTKTHGTGLGLAICRRIVTDLGGEIRIDSTPGAGTTVSTWLPAAPA